MEKKGILRRLQRAKPNAVILAADETILRMFPPLRMAWALRGRQAQVRITGENAKRVLIGAIDLHTGQRRVRQASTMGQAGFQQFLRDLRHRYPSRPVYLLLDKSGSHQAAGTLREARRLKIHLLWLPRQCPELNPMDHLWRELKRRISANRQYRTMDQHATQAERWVLSLSPQEAMRKAGLFSKNFWLRT